MTPKARYQRDLERPDFFADEAQARAVDALDDVFQRVVAEHRRRQTWLGRFRRPRAQQGLYMWGGVGRGKTYLMDLFFDALPFEQKVRFHFHRFMQKVHRDMRARQGEKNPLESIARDFAKSAQVLCFDEFFVTDITDAMILATLLKTLFDEGVTLVATSNIIPDQLYQDGLQRARFLPAIALLKEKVRVLNVDSGTDYRLRLLTQAHLYHSPWGVEAEAFLHERFATLAGEPALTREQVRLNIEGRKIAAQRVNQGVVWFEFRDICDGPRSQNDYIEVAREFHTVLLANVEQMGATLDDVARRFINLVDEFYDRSVKLIITSAVPIEDIYTTGRLDFEFARTRSRLQEMQSEEYLAQPHKP